jgi:hypothetical protein
VVKPPKVIKSWNHQEKQVKIDINRFMAKYDFDIAKKICPTISGATYHDEFANVFKENALMEVLQECSEQFSNGEKIYQSLYTFDGKFISSLEAIPKDCKLLLVSESAPPKERLDEKSSYSPKNKTRQSINDEKFISTDVDIGLKSNIYEFSTEGAELKHKVKRLEDSMKSRKLDWVNTNHKQWVETTPFIYDKHKTADVKLQVEKPNQSFVSIRRVQPKLPNIKDLIAPFMTEAIDE